MNKGQKVVWVDGKRYTPFELEWGTSVEKLAQQEQTTPEAIRMRLKRFGTPFQRKAKPTKCEILHGKTVWQLASELGITHITVHKILKDNKDPYENVGHGNRGKDFGGKKFSAVNPAQSGWLMPQHPDYLTWRDKYEPVL